MVSASDRSRRRCEMQLCLGKPMWLHVSSCTTSWENIGVRRAVILPVPCGLHWSLSHNSVAPLKVEICWDHELCIIITGLHLPTILVLSWKPGGLRIFRPAPLGLLNRCTVSPATNDSLPRRVALVASSLLLLSLKVIRMQRYQIVLLFRLSKLPVVSQKC